MTSIARRLRALIALAGFCALCAACGPAPTDSEPVTSTESAVSPPNVNAMADSVWGYYTGNLTGPRPTMTMFTADKACSPISLGGGQYVYRFASLNGLCLWDVGAQVQQAHYNFWATYEIWQTNAHPSSAQMPWYATLAINFLCTAAYERAGFSYAQAYPYCSGGASSTVPFVRQWIHDTYFSGTPFWQ